MSNIFVFHGDDIVRSRQAFTDKLSQYDPVTTEIIRLDGKNLDENCIQTNLYSTSMFHDSRLIIIDNLFSLPKSVARDTSIQLLSQVTDTAVMVWENKEIETKSYTSSFVFQVFKLPNELFAFLDHLDPANPKESLVMLEKVKDQVDENYLFLMLARQIRLLIMAKGGETVTLLPWQTGKLIKQAAKFSEHQLFAFYHQLRDIDYHQKTSQGMGGYLSEIEFLLINL